MPNKNNVLKTSDVIFFLTLVFAQLVSTQSMKHAWALLPRDTSSIWTVFTAPMMHSDYSHLSNNLFSLVTLSLILRAFFNRHFNRVFIFSYLFPGIFTWFIGRHSYHLGASGIVYGMGFFIIISSLLRKERELTAISLILVLFNGSAVWGLLPMKDGISWEYHLGGAIIGTFYAYYAKKSDVAHQKREQLKNQTNYNCTAQNIEIDYTFQPKEETDLG